MVQIAGLIVTQSMLDLWRELTNERSTTAVPDSVVYTYLQRGAERLNQRVGYHLTDDNTTVVFGAGTQEYATPTDTVEIVFVEHNGQVLQKSDIEQWRRDKVSWRTEAQGMPREFAWYGSTLVFRPIPNAAAVAAAASPLIRYVSTPRDIATYGFEQLATQHQPIVVYGAVALWSTSYPDSPVAQMRAEYHEKLFTDEAEMVKAFYQERRIAK